MKTESLVTSIEVIWTRYVWTSDLSYASFVAHLWHGRSSLRFLSNDEQKCHKTNPHEKHRHQNSPKRALLCSVPGFGILSTCSHFDPCYCSHWHTNPSDIPTTTWLGPPQGQGETLFASLHACLNVRPRVFLLRLIRLVAATHSQLVCAHSPDGGEPCGRADLGPLDEMGLLDEVIYISVLHWSPL